MDNLFRQITEAADIRHITPDYGYILHEYPSIRDIILHVFNDYAKPDITYYGFCDKGHYQSTIKLCVDYDMQIRNNNLIIYFNAHKKCDSCSEYEETNYRLRIIRMPELLVVGKTNLHEFKDRGVLRVDIIDNFKYSKIGYVVNNFEFQFVTEIQNINDALCIIYKKLD